MAAAVCHSAVRCRSMIQQSSISPLPTDTECTDREMLVFPDVPRRFKANLAMDPGWLTGAVRGVEELEELEDLVVSFRRHMHAPVPACLWASGATATDREKK